MPSTDPIRPAGADPLKITFWPTTGRRGDRFTAESPFGCQTEQLARSTARARETHAQVSQLQGEVVRLSKPTKGFARSDRGAAMVEFALVVPLFLALVFGVISYGYMLSFRQAVSQAAAEAARAVAVVPATVVDPNVRVNKAANAVKDALGGYDIDCTGGKLIKNATQVGTCGPPVVGNCDGDTTRRCATVTVTHNYRDNPLMPSFPGFGFSLPEKLTYTAVIEVS